MRDLIAPKVIICGGRLIGSAVGAVEDFVEVGRYGEPPKGRIFLLSGVANATHVAEH